jgi:hypothetical protein
MHARNTSERAQLPQPIASGWLGIRLPRRPVSSQAGRGPGLIGRGVVPDNAGADPGLVAVDEIGPIADLAAAHGHEAVLDLVRFATIESPHPILTAGQEDPAADHAQAVEVHWEGPHYAPPFFAPLPDVPLVTAGQDPSVVEYPHPGHDLEPRLRQRSVLMPTRPVETRYQTVISRRPQLIAPRTGEFVDPHRQAILLFPAGPVPMQHHSFTGGDEDQARLLER